MLKASDLRSLFGPVSQNHPLFFSTQSIRNIKIPGVKSEKLKFKSQLCSHCNNERTQPHDRAWEALSKYLRERNPPIRPGSLVKLTPVFPGRVRQSMLNVHLYFLKLFGCLVVENAIPLDINTFAQAIMLGQAHPRVYLAFWAFTDSRIQKHAGQSEVQTAQLHGQIAYASWFYYIGPLAVNVIYSEPTEQRRGLVHAWQPKNIAKFIRITGE